MRRFLLLFIGLAAAFAPVRANAQERTQVQLETSEGTIVIALYDETPLHRDNFIKKVREGVYDGRTFNRVVQGFVVQCGEEQGLMISIPRA